MSSELGAQASIAIIVSFGLQWVKKSEYFPWITTKTEKVNQWVSIGIAFFTGVGIFATWDHGTLTITGLTASNVLHAATRGIQQWVFQTTAYRTLIAPPQPGVVQAMLERRVGLPDRRQPPPAEEKKEATP